MEKVTFGDASIPGYECGDKSAPAVVVLQEWWGITETIKRQALKLHTDGGFRVIVPDLYKGELGVDAEEAHHLMTNLDWPNAKAELVECARYLKATGSPKVGVVGFCMGGALALIAAQHADDVTCAAPFYGTPDPGICQTEKISKPVQAHFGAMDNLAGFSDPDAATKLLANLQAAGSDCELHTYPNVGHAFMNDTPDPYATWEARRKAQGFPPYDETQVNVAWSRLLRFFEKHLVG